MSLPWWASRTTLAPLSASSRTVGTQASIRLVERRVPAARSTGWLMSTRQRTVLPETSQSSRVKIPNRMAALLYWAFLNRPIFR